MVEMSASRKSETAEPAEAAAQLGPDDLAALVTRPGDEPDDALVRHQITERLQQMRVLLEGFEQHLGRQLTVNPTDLTAMEHLISAGPLSPTELASRLQVSTAAATMVVDRLEAVGHVTRRRHPTDRRRVEVVPQPASVAKAFAHLSPMIAGVAGVLDDFNPEERAAIARFLDGVNGVYRAVVDPAPPVA